MRWAGDVGNKGRERWGGEQEGGRVEGGKREDTSLLEGLGVWGGLGLHLPPHTTDTPDTPALRVNGMQWGDMSHHQRERDTATEARGLRNQLNMWTDTLCMCVFKEELSWIT